VAGAIVVDLQAIRREGQGELAAKLVGDGAHYVASLFAGCQFLIGKSSASYFGQ
jgi:hypothetical protein